MRPSARGTVRPSHGEIQLPLTPPPTSETSRAASWGLDTSDLADALDLTEVSTPLLDAVDEHLRHFEDTLAVVSENEEAEWPASDPEEYYKNQPHWDQPAELPAGRPAAPSRSGHHRSSSAPAKPLKSALAKSPPDSPPGDSEGAVTRKKKIRFEDDPSGSDLSLQRVRTAPANIGAAFASEPFARVHRHVDTQVTWSGDDDESGRGYEVQRTALNADNLEELREALAAEADDAASEMAEDASAAERLKEESDDAPDATTPLEDAFDSEHADLSSRGSVSDIEQDVLDTAEDNDDDMTSASPEDRSEDGPHFGTPDEVPDRSHPYLAQLETFEDNDNGSIDVPTDQEEDDTSGESPVLPVIQETEVLTSAPASAPRQIWQPPAILNPRHRLSDPHMRGRNNSPVLGVKPRASSLTDFQRLSSRLNLHPLKASPAQCAVTVCSVRAAEQPKVNTVYSHPAARYKLEVRDTRPTQTIQTVCSGSSTYQMLWEEPSRASSDSDVTLFEEAEIPDVDEPEIDEPVDSLVAHVSRTPSPMRKVKTKLAAWSWAREQEMDEDDETRFVPLMAFEEGNSYMPSSMSNPAVEVEDPPAPPNTTKTSGASSVRQSVSHTPHEDHDTAEYILQTEHTESGQDPIDVEDDTPVELRFRSTLSRVRSMPASTEYLAIPTESWSLPVTPDGSRVPRQLSNLAAEDEHFKGHRDSVDLHHRRERDEMINSQLMATRDSFVLAKSKYDTRHPKASGGGAPIQYSRFGGLSPILDASPQTSKIQLGSHSLSRLGKESKEVEKAHPDEHVGCAIYEIDRPRWFEANCKRAMGEIRKAPFLS